ncbi:hypothetical protein CJ026_026325 [Ralstonia pickettii]|nr:hypothetical protein CJ026_026325 [Ralstonia pickettii]
MTLATADFLKAQAPGGSAFVIGEALLHRRRDDRESRTVERARPCGIRDRLDGDEGVPRRAVRRCHRRRRARGAARATCRADPRMRATRGSAPVSQSVVASRALVRVSVQCEGRRLDIGIPAQLPLIELMPGMTSTVCSPASMPATTSVSMRSPSTR